MYNDGVRKYQENDLNSIGPERMIVMLYEGVERRIADARAAIDADDIVGRARHLDKARDIITELNHSLDFEVGGTIAANLSALYGFVGRELLEARITGRVRHLDNVLRVIRPVLEAWRSVAPGTAARARAEAVEGGVEDGPELAKAGSSGPGDDARKTRKDLCVAV